MSLTCPWGCGWKGSALDYLEHYNECPARVCPKCGSTDVFFHRKDAIECLTCGNRWPRKEVPEDAKTWLIRDEVFVEVEAGEEMMVEKPLETPVEEEAGESSTSPR